MGTERPAPLRVLVAGGGVAAIEFTLALRALAGRRVEIEVVAPGSELVYRPWAVAEPFGLATSRRFNLAGILEDQDATLVRWAVAEIDPARRRVRTNERRELRYDVLVIATGAVGERAVPGALQFAGREADIAAFARLLDRAEEGGLSALALAVPGGVAWPLPVYELAFLTRTYLDRRGREEVAITLVTPEDAPLTQFGHRVSKAVASLADEWRIGVHTRRYPVAYGAGRLETQPGPTLAADEAVALPRLGGPSLGGLPSDAGGFLPTDEHARVRGVDDVYAIGDVTTFPVKQGGIAAQQADVAAEAVAAVAGAAGEPQPFRPVLRALLLTGSTPTYLTNELAGGHGDASMATAEPPWWPPTKIAGRYLGPYLATKAAAEPSKLPIRRLEIDDLEPYLTPK